MALLNAITLALTIPLIVITCRVCHYPVALRRRSEVPVSKGVLYVVMVALGMVPQDWAHVLSDVVMVGAFFSTYVLPAAIHIIMHNFRRPLSIVIPPSAPITPNPAYTRDPPYLSNSHIYPSPSGLSASSPLSASSSRDDELLQRKEQTLQRRRLTRRIVWDIGVWVLLLPVGGGGLVWAAGRIAGRW
ncbi:hypothetical protein QCA50_006947 [Cerrena zonata]|uniref:Amino acid transporter transmembrane domain-containing protein n=1 Tax=Cerrena zonata TaxID=2478898 RepID=A0AAW0GAA4_9APHY